MGAPKPGGCRKRRRRHHCTGDRDQRAQAQERRARADGRHLEGSDDFLRDRERPATSMICSFITEHRAFFGVAPICRVLTEYGCKIAPRTYYAHLGRAPSNRSLWETTISEILADYYEPKSDGPRKAESLYGATKMWARLKRQGIPVTRCTVERLMRKGGWQGVRRTKRVRTTIPDPGASRAPDLLKRNFRTTEPDEVHVADFTYVPMTSGFAYTAFVIDAFAGLIVGWECSLSKETAFVERAIRQAASYRRRRGRPLGGSTIHHSDAGSHYTALRFRETLMLEGLQPSIGSVGDAFDNALAETTIGLYKTECVRSDSPFRRGPIATLSDLEELTSSWVSWYNESRLMHRLGRRPPAEVEAEYYDARAHDQIVVHT
ncbi:MAG: IS3 family transposase [Acidimicrobiales bacterium]